MIRDARTDDAPAVRELLVDCKLPIDGVPDDLTLLLVAEHEGRVVGSVALEVYGAEGLLRSLAVSPDLRCHGAAGLLCDEIECRAAAVGARRLFLLTESAAEFFVRRGFRPTERARAPDGIAESREFAAICPASAAFLYRELIGA